jgi:adenine-specific DNA-methyltransferase
MPNLNITKPELIWPGKYDDAGKRVVNRGAALPFQVIETIREGRATRAAGGPDLFAFANQKTETVDSDTWHNKLIWGDNLLVMSSLLQQYAGKIDLIYIDPPFATGADFSFTTEIGDSDLEVFKEQSSIEEKAYRDTWGNGAISYYAMLYSRLTLIRDLLSSKGTLYLGSTGFGV